MAHRPTPTPPSALRLAIVHSGLKQREVAEAAGIRHDTLSKIVNERVRPNARERDLLSGVLDVDAQELWPDLEQAAS